MRPLGTVRCRWENDIKIDVKKIEWGCVDQTFLDLCQ
jgi:hypothetical protein